MFIGVALRAQELISHNFLMTKSVLNLFLGHDRGLFVGGENKNYLNLIRGNNLYFIIILELLLLRVDT